MPLLPHLTAVDTPTEQLDLGEEGEFESKL